MQLKVRIQWVDMNSPFRSLEQDAANFKVDRWAKWNSPLTKSMKRQMLWQRRHFISVNNCTHKSWVLAWTRACFWSLALLLGWPEFLDSILPRCLKITEIVSFNIASEASYVYFLSGQNLIKNAKNGPILRFSNATFWVIFKHCENGRPKNNLGSNLKNICALLEKRFVAWQLQKSEEKRMLMIEIELGFMRVVASAREQWAIM